MLRASPEDAVDAKTRLQEWLQARGEGLPLYTVLEVSGSAHDQTFRVCCELRQRKLLAEAASSSRRSAEKLAAAEMLSKNLWKRMTDKRCGVIAIVGRPNVGKSTLLNHLLGQKLSITSRKPQTTRNQVLGVRTDGHLQFIFVDTPGLHLGQSKAINQAMNKAASSALSGVDLILFLCDRAKWTEEDEFVMSLIAQQSSPAALVVNKVDLIQDQSTLLPFIEGLSSRFEFDAVLPVSALRSRGLDELVKYLERPCARGSTSIPRGSDY